MHKSISDENLLIEYKIYESILHHKINNFFFTCKSEQVAKVTTLQSLKTVIYPN